jgi:hypothetical protein
VTSADQVGGNRCKELLGVMQHTCGSISSSVHASMTLPGSAKQQKLSTWPFTTASSPQMPRQNQMTFFRPRYSCCGQ